MLGLPNIAKFTPKSELHPLVFSARAVLRDRRQANLNFALSSNNKDQLTDSNNYSNQKLITAINTLDGSSLVDNLITSQQNDQDSPVTIPKVGSITSLV